MAAGPAPKSITPYATGNGGICGGEELRERRLSAVEFVDDYYRSISQRRFVTAWRMLAARQRRQIGPFRRWKAGHRRTLGVSVLSSRARLSGRRAVVMTMGALHEGHATLIRTAREIAGTAGEVVVTVFVNPLQFGAG